MKPPITTPIRPLLVAIGGTLIVLVLVFIWRPWSPTDTADRITADEAVGIARDFVVAGQASNEDIRQITTDAPAVVERSWRVKVDAFVVYGAPDGATPRTSDQPIWIHYLVDVDRMSGSPSIFAQG
jgi:hypothetical protein